MKKNQNGFSVVEVTLVIVVILIIGGLGWVFYGALHKQATTGTSASSSQPRQQNTSVAAQTTYTWKSEKLHFAYPSNWKLTDSDGTNIYVTSPVSAAVTDTDGNQVTGNMQLYATSYGDDSRLNGLDYIVKSLPLTMPNYKAMSIIEHGSYTSADYTQELTLSDTVSSVGKIDDSQALYYDTFASKTNPSTRVSISAGLSVHYTGQTAFAVISTPTFESLKDYNTAIAILKSVSY